MDMCQSQLTVQAVQFKIKMIRSKTKTFTGCFSLKGSSGGVKLNKNKTVKHISTQTASPPYAGSFVAGVGPSQPTGANRGRHRPGPVATT